MSERIMMAKVYGKKIVTVVEDLSRPEFLHFKDKYGDTIFQVHRDWLFDKDGNFFQTD